VLVLVVRQGRELPSNPLGVLVAGDPGAPGVDRSQTHHLAIDDGEVTTVRVTVPGESGSVELVNVLPQDCVRDGRGAHGRKSSWRVDYGPEWPG